MTGCPKGSFNCDDGMCIDLAKKCDSSSDCQDDSDEKNCTIVVPSRDYNMDKIPTKHIVSVSVIILDILNIDISSGNVGLKLGITLEWIDSRLNFLNLNNPSSTTVLSSNESSSIWKPDLVYNNKMPFDFYVYVEPEVSILKKNPTTIDPYMVTAYLYSGETNPLQWSTVIRYFLLSYLLYCCNL